MKTETIKFKKFSADDLIEYLLSNNLRQIHRLTEQIVYHIEHDIEFVIMQSGLFEGYRIVPKWNLGEKSSRLDDVWYNWYIKSSESFPEDMFDKRTMKDYETPWGMQELYMPWSLFRVSPGLLELFNNVPRCGLHGFLEDYSIGNIQPHIGTLSNQAEEWPLSLSIAIDDKSKISFFTPKKIYDMLKSDALGFTTWFDKTKSLAENMSDHSLRKRKGTMTSFGRALEKLCNYHRSWDRTYENQFEDAFMLNGLDDLNVEFELWPAKRIPEAYHGDNYWQDEGGNSHGTLGRSCMRSEQDQMKVKFYARLGKNLKILVLIKDSKIMARSLIWQNCYNRRCRDSFQVMDRVYAHSNKYEILFHNYAKNNGIVRKKLNSYTNNTLIQPCGKGGIGACFTQLPGSIKKMYDSDKNCDRHEKKLYWPWLDTFKFYDSEANCLVTHKQLGGRYKMQSTSGHHSARLYSEYSLPTYEDKTQKLIQIIESKNLKLTC